MPLDLVFQQISTFLEDFVPVVYVLSQKTRSKILVKYNLKRKKISQNKPKIGAARKLKKNYVTKKHLQTSKQTKK